MQVAAGDVVFYRGKPGSVFDDVIEVVEHGGDVVHCEMVISPTESIGALAAGVTRHAIPTGGIVARTSSRIAPDRLPIMLGWLQSRVGTPYGWKDAAAAAAADLDPGGPFVVRGDAMDCSHLCTVALEMAGYPLPPALYVMPATVTPEELYQALKDVVDREE